MNWTKDKIGMAYKNDIKNNGFDVLLTPEREKELSHVILHSKNKNLKREAVNELVGHNLRLVINIASKHYGQVKFCAAISFEDLISAGNLGLHNAALTFDASYGRFTSYAYRAIQTSIWGFIDDNKSTIRTPRIHDEIMFKISKAQLECGEKADLSEISKETEVTVERMQDVMDAQVKFNVTSLNAASSHFEDGCPMELIDSMEDKKALIELQRTIDFDDKTKYVLEKMEVLSEKEQVILFMEFFSYENFTLEEIGDVLGLTKERVRQILSDSLRNIKWYIARDGESDLICKPTSTTSKKVKEKCHYASYEELQKVADIIKEEVVGDGSVSLDKYISLIKKIDMNIFGWRINKIIQKDLRLAAFLPKDIFKILRKKSLDDVHFSKYDIEFIEINRRKGADWISKRMFCDKRRVCYRLSKEAELEETENKIKHPAHSYSKEEEDFIRIHKDKGIRWIANELCLSSNAVRHKAVRMGVDFAKRKRTPAYTKEDDQLIIENAKTKGYDWLAKHLNRTSVAIEKRYYVICKRYANVNP